MRPQLTLTTFQIHIIPILMKFSHMYTLLWKHTNKWRNICTFQIPSAKKKSVKSTIDTDNSSNTVLLFLFLWNSPSVYTLVWKHTKFFIPITYTFIIKTHSIEQFNQNEITLQDCGIIIIYIYFFMIIIIPALIFISHARVLLDNFY